MGAKKSVKSVSKRIAKRAEKLPVINRQKKRQTATKEPGDSLPIASARSKAVAGKTAAKKKPSGRKTTPSQRAKELNIEERRSLVSDYAVTGASLRQIAELVTKKGYPCSHVTVKEDLDALFEEEKALQVTNVEKLRWQGNKMLWGMWMAFYSLTHHSKNIGAAYVSLAVLSRLFDLNGVDKPKTVNVNHDPKGTLAALLGVAPDELPDKLSDE